MKNRNRGLAAAVMATMILVSACNMHTMNGVGREFDEAIKTGNWQHASQIYNQNQAFFSGKTSSFQGSYDQLAAAVNHNLVPGIEQFERQLSGIRWPEPVERWGYVGDVLAQANEALARYNQHQLLRGERYRAPAADRLQEILNEKEAVIAVGAPEAFANFDHFGKKSFFDRYPVSLNANRFLTRHYPSIKDRISGASLVELDRFMSNYRPGQDLTGLAAEHAQTQYMAALTRNYSDGAQPDLLDSWSILEQARSKGIETGKIARGRFVVVEVPSRSRLSEKAIEFPISLESDLAFEVRHARLEKALQDPVGAKADYLVIVDLGQSSTSLKKGEGSAFQSRYYSHSTFSTNPAYLEAQNEVRQAQIALQHAQEDQFRHSNPSLPNDNSSAGAWAAVIGDIITSAAGASQVAAAEERLARRAQETLNRTPPQLEQKQYVPYSLTRVPYQGRKRLTLSYYVVDRKSGKYVRGSMLRTEERDFSLLEGLRPGDPDVTALEDGFATRAEMRAWQQQAAMSVRLSEVIEDYKLRRSKAASLPALALIQQDLFDQRNKAMRRAAQQRVSIAGTSVLQPQPSGHGAEIAVTGNGDRAGYENVTEIGYGRVADFQFPRGSVNPNAYAIVIGVRNYDDRDIPPVDYALNDADAVRQYLVKTRGFADENVILLENPTHSALLAQFGSESNHRGKLYDTVREEGIREVFVFFSGHGIPTPSGSGVILPRDGDPLKPEFTGYGLDILIRNLNKLPGTRVTLAVDSCFSGVSAGGSLIREASPVFLSAQSTRRGLDNGVVFTAADGSEIASWDRSVRLGLFTRHLLEGLIGKADQLGDRNGTVEVYEMDRYLREAVGKDANRRFSRRQTPQTLGNPDFTVNKTIDSNVQSIDQIMALAN